MVLVLARRYRRPCRDRGRRRRRWLGGGGRDFFGFCVGTEKKQTDTFQVSAAEL